MKFHYIKSSEKKKLLAQLKEQFGITKLPYLLIETGKEKVRGFSGNLTKEEIKALWNATNIEIIGMYLFKKEKREKLRLSLDASHILKNQITKNIFELSDKQLEDWIRGRDITAEAPEGILAIKHNSDFIGNGLSTGQKIINHVPKERRIRN